jgi:heme-degrading monooxygenase HmoA
MHNFVTLRRWALREGASEDELLALVRDGIVPAYRRQPGCLSLNLLKVADSSSFLAITYWDSRASFENWAGEAGHQWREDYRPTLERWLELMVFQEELEADLLIVG